MNGRKSKPRQQQKDVPDTTPDYDQKREVCGGRPVLGDLRMCAVCVTGDADALEDFE